MPDEYCWSCTRSTVELREVSGSKLCKACFREYMRNLNHEIKVANLDDDDSYDYRDHVHLTFKEAVQFGQFCIEEEKSGALAAGLTMGDLLTIWLDKQEWDDEL